MSRCAVCGQSLAPSCPNRLCHWPNRHFSVVFAAGVHQGALRRAIVRYKYGGDAAVLPALSGMLASFLAARQACFEEFDLMTAVPAFIGAGARRQWDPVGRLLASLAPLLPGWRIEPGLVAKRSETPPMAGVPWSSRREIATGPLRASLAVPDPGPVKGRQILVVDDVLTEGGTLSEVARALRMAGASDVAGLVIARLPWLPDRPNRI